MIFERPDELIEHLIEDTPYAIAFWNPEGAAVRWNRAFAALFGAEPSPEFRLFRDPQIAEGGYMRDFEAALAGESRSIPLARYRVPGPEGESRDVWARLTVFGIGPPERRLVVAVYQDLTEQHETEARRAQLEDQLLEAQKLRAIGTLAGGVAHDFNNILTGIAGYVDLLRATGPAELRPYLDKLDTLARRGSDLTRQLLAYARKSRLETRAHDMNGTAREVAALIKQTVDRRIRVLLALSEEPVTVEADPGQMSQVLLNLCVNARDALEGRLRTTDPADSAVETPPFIRIESRQTVINEAQARRWTDARPGRYVRVTVRDNGAGMDEATRARIFEPFFTTKRVGKGTGLGLATVLGIVNQHRGWVEVKSAPGEGTVFHVYLPAVDAAATPLSDAAASLSVRGGTETILFADDEEAIREMARDSLERLGYRVILARDGRECLELFEKRADEIALTVVDLTMPRMSGKEALMRVRRLRPDARAIVASGYFVDETGGDVTEMGISAFLQKPYSSLDLARAVRRTLDQGASRSRRVE